MKATKSTDGEYRFSMKIKFRVGADDIRSVIGWLITNEKKITKKIVLEKVRERLYMYGDHHTVYYYDEDDSEKYVDEIESYFERLFPELHSALVASKKSES